MPSNHILFRKKEWDFLTNFFGPPLCLPYPCLFIYGHSSTGKSLLVSNFLKEANVRHAWVNCHEISTAPLLFTSVLNQTLDCEPNTKFCSNLCDFVNMLKDNLKNCQNTIVLVFDNAEVLRNKYSNVLPALARLQELTKLNICTVFISDILWEKFRSPVCVFDPIVLHFSDYTKEELIEILCLDCPSDYTKDFYEGYASVIMKVFYVVTRNLNELRHVGKLNFLKYCEPIVLGQADESNVHKLFKNIEPTLKDAIHAVYLREVSGPKWSMLLKENSSTKQAITLHSSSKHDATVNSTITSQYHMTKELPFYSKFLLLACYFASYNLPKTDYKHFVKNQGKQKKKRVGRKTEKNRHMLGPKSFSLDRMLSIFFAIVGSGVQPSALILSQIASLVSLQLVSRVSVDEQLDTPKYKCLAELDLVRNIGKTVNIDIMGYLDDYV